VNVETLSATLGARVRGIDLAAPPDEATFENILTLFGKHRLLVFPDQSLDGVGQVGFSRRFGSLEGHVRHSFRDDALPDLHVVSNLDAQGLPTTAVRTTGNFHWHTDKSYMAIPSLATMLHALQLPPSGGNTCFADMCAAFEALEPAQQQRLRPLRAIHSWEISRVKAGSPAATLDEIEAAPPVAHPLVRRHGPTGTEALYLGNHAAFIDGWDRHAGEALLAELLAHATKPQFVYEHAWKLGDFVMWDNRCLLHRANADFDLGVHPRVLNRTVVRGDASP
jgi:taurine dioxygenase